MESSKIKILVILIIAVLMLSIYPPLASSGHQNIKLGVSPAIVSNEIEYGYVANGNPYVNYITVFNRQTMDIAENITVGYAPAGIVTSPNGSFVYVSNFVSNNVSVISTGSNEVIRSINVGTSPDSIAVSPDGDYVLVANTGSSSVSIINTSTFSVTNVTVGGVPGGYNGIFGQGYPTGIPDGIVFSPNSTFAYVGNAVGNVTVVNLKSDAVVRQITVSTTYPVNGLAISESGLYLYAVINEYVPANDYGSHVSVISTQSFSILYNISTDFEPESIALNGNGNLAYVTSGYNNTVDVLNITTKALVNRYPLPRNSIPIGIYFSHGYQLMYVADSGNNSISVINIATGSVLTYPIGVYPMSISMADLYPVNFEESGLPSSTTWSVIVNSINITGNGLQIQFLEPNGSYSYALGIVSGYRPNQNYGTFTVAGNALSITILWTRVTYQISFKESGLPSGTRWDVTLNNTTNSSTSNVINFIEPNGTYSFVIGTVPGYRTANKTGQIFVNGGNAVRNIVWSVNTYSISFVESGLRAGTLWSVTLNGALSSSKSTNISFSEPNGSYSYTIDNINGYIANNYSGTITVNGANITVSVSWFPILYTIYFNETGLPAGTPWSVTLNGTVKTSTTSTIMFSEPNGSYIFSIESISGYTISPQFNTINVDGASVHESITFSPVPPATYEITFMESGLPTGTNWSVTFNGITNYSTSNSIFFYAKNGTYSYSIGMISGYSVNPSSGNIIVSGSSINNVVSFSPIVAGQYYIIFEESGLPTGTNWSVTFNGITKYSTGNTITFTASNGTYSYAIAVPSEYSVQNSQGTITVDGKSLTVPVNSSKTSVFPWLLILIIILLIVAVLIVLIILMKKRKRPGQPYYGSSQNYPPPGPFQQNPPSPPQQQYPGAYPQAPAPPTPPNYPSRQQQYPSEIKPQQNIPATTYTENAVLQKPGQQYPYQNVQQNQSFSGQEVLLFNHPGAMLLKIDDKVVSRPPYSGTIYISNKNFIFLSKGKSGSAALMLGAATGGIVQKSLSNVDLQEINKYLNSNGSFIVSVSNISSISAGTSSMLKGSFIKISAKVPVNPYGTNVAGYNVEFTFLPKGYIGAAILKKEEAEYINTTIAQMVGK
ncbi:MAG: YncE family protein [Thermoplasmata archaeon]